MKRCNCEHWETCPICYPQGFDEHGVRKPVEIPPTREELQAQVEKLKAELESIDGALNDPRANLTLTTSEIIWELKEQVAALAKESGK